MGCKEHLKLSVKNKKENISLFEIIIVGEITLNKRIDQRCLRYNSLLQKYMEYIYIYIAFF